MRQRSRVLFLGVLMVVAALVAIPSPVHASTVFDDVIHTTTTLELKSANGLHDVQGVQHTYPGIMSAKCASEYAEFVDDSDETNFHVAILQYNNSATESVVSIVWTVDSGATTTFTSWPGYTVVAIEPFTNYATLYVDNSGNVHCYTDTDVSAMGQILGADFYASDYLEVLLSTYPVAYPTGWEGEDIPTVRPAAEYVAMGDSFSSGEGSPPFEAGTNEAGVNTCHRSLDAYPYLLHAEYSLGLTDFIACSGATSDMMRDGGSGHGAWEVKQIDSLSTSTELVTITAGGNNIKFSDFASACVYGSCATTSAEYLESWDIMTDLLRSDYLPARLDALFSDMVFNLYLNTEVEVYVIGYPYVITHASWEGRGVGICTDFDENEAIAAESLVLKLNSVIEQAVEDFDDSRFIYVDPLATGSPFLGHELCTSGGYFNGIEAAAPPGEAAYVFHPNADGQQAYADLIGAYMD